MNQSLIITDLDNTLYNFVDFFAPSFRSMVHALSYKTGIDENSLISQFKDVYARHDTIEYRDAVEELALCRGKSKDKITELVYLARLAFDRTHRKTLKPYSKVRETLFWANESCIPVVGITNAPMRVALYRLGQLELAEYFVGVAAYEGTEDIELGSIRSRIKKRWHLKKTELKPSPLGYCRIFDDENLNSEKRYVIGDSLEKDLAPAMSIGAIGIWAKYGAKFDKKNLETLLRITPWGQEKINQAYHVSDTSPDFIIQNFEDITAIVPQNQLTIF